MPPKRATPACAPLAACSASRYNSGLIACFEHKGLGRYVQRGVISAIQVTHAVRLRLRLGRLNTSTHPGDVLKELCLEPLGLSVTDAAKALGVSRKALSSILNGRAGISPEMAVRLSIAFDTTSESWMNQQMQFDLWQAEQRRGELMVTSLTAL